MLAMVNGIQEFGSRACEVAIVGSQGKGYGPVGDAIGVVFWVIAALVFSGVCGVVMAFGAFLAGLLLG